MAPIPTPPSATVAAIFAAWEARQELPRPHLGASVLGRPCDRELWYTFRWTFTKHEPGRILRLLQRGRREEETLIADLRAIGATVHAFDPATGRQFEFRVAGGHVGGSMDACAIGLPEAPKTWHAVEFKTHSAKSFRELTAKGVKESKPAHWVQAQLYMRWSSMERALYLGVSKDTDDLYGERIKIDVEAGARYEARGERIVRAAEPPPRISDDPDWFECKMCPAAKLCHSRDRVLAEVNCRTCAHATPEMDGNGRWSCALHGSDLDEATQRKGCAHHRYIPALVHYAQPIDASATANWIEYITEDGQRIRNGAAGHGGLSSLELRRAETVPVLSIERGAA